jgi:hypothetical protein
MVDLTFVREGGYGLVAAVHDAATDQVLAQQSASVIVGNYQERNITYEICDTWSASQAGGEGMTMDHWNITMIPTGAIFDLSYDMFTIPDKLLMEYPAGNLVLDTGERLYNVVSNGYVNIS